MSQYCENGSVNDHRIRSFVDAADEAILTGVRRMGRVQLMNVIANFLVREQSDANIVYVKDAPEDMHKFFSKELKGEDIVLIYSVMDVPDWEKALRLSIKGKVTVYLGQDLCHQVPACFKRIISDI